MASHQLGSLFDTSEAEIAFNSAGVTYMVIVDGTPVSGQAVPVQLLVTQIGVNLHAVMVCEINGHGACDAPPNVLLKVMIPDKMFTYKFCQAILTMTITSESNRTYYLLQFDHDDDFWAVMSMVSEAHLDSTGYEARVERLIDDALRHLPTNPGANVER
ncbi:hypothetical protein C8Q74DRAFT_1222096 [Fomes fomentarius]|nr:hypothetical protein C8Q74DRAFT_1222096 [Fomes fomentarius]